MNIDFEDFFDLAVLERGHDYYLQGGIVEIKVSPTHVDAYVLGNQRYHVTMSLHNGVIEESHCDCPYTLDSHCKHEAAVLYAIREGDYESINDCEMNEVPDKNALEQIPKDELICYLLKLLKEDSSFCLDFSSYFGAYFKTSSYAYLNEWYHIRNQNSDRYGFIDYKKSTDFSIDVTCLIEKMTHAAQFHPMVIFDALTKMYTQLADLAIDDSNGTTQALAYELQELILVCFEHADQERKEQIQKWIQTAQNDTDLKGYGLDDGLDELYLKTRPLCEQIKYLEQHVSNSYELNELLEAYEKANIDEITVFNKMKKLKCIKAASDWLITYYLKHEQSEEAIEVLKSNKQYEDYVVQLIHLYKKTSHYDDYEKAMYSYLTGDYNNIASLYQEYREQSQPDVWKNKCVNLIQSMKSSYDRITCYAIEEMKEPLLNELKISQLAPYQIYKYESLLSPEYDAILIDLYRKKAEAFYPYAKNSNYREIVDIIQHIMSLTNGIVTAKEMITELKGKYKTRRNLMSQLRELSVFEEC